MSEEETEAQVGALALEYSEAKGHLNHLQEKLNRALLQYQQISNQITFDGLRIIEGFPCGNNQPYNHQVKFDSLLSSKELAEVIEARNAKRAELNNLAARLKAVAPHLI